MSTNSESELNKKVEIPTTLEDFKKVRETILNLMSNPYCDQFMFLSLSEKLDKTDAKIKELTPTISIGNKQ